MHVQCNMRRKDVNPSVSIYIAKYIRLCLILCNSHMSCMYVLFISEFEASFIRLVDKVTNGSKVVISETGMLNAM